MAPFRLELRRKNPSGLLVAALLLFNGLGLALVLIAGRYPTSLYVRNALFSEVVDDQQVPSEAALNTLLKHRIRQDPSWLPVRSLFTSTELVRLDGLVSASRRGDCRLPSDSAFTVLSPADCLARALAKDVSPYMMGGKCGLDGSLRSRIGSVQRGVGCCSDYNEAFLLRAQATGLQAREVHNMGHTTAEYFDPLRQRWHWLDTSNRVQVADGEGQLLSAYQIRSRFPWRALRFIDLPPFSRDPKASGDQFVGYLSSANSILFWSKGQNILQIEAFEGPLRRIGLPKELVQASSLGLGVRPGWLVLASPEAAFRFRLSSWLLKAGLVGFVLSDLVLLAAALGFRLTRNRVFR